MQPQFLLVVWKLSAIKMNKKIKSRFSFCCILKVATGSPSYFEVH